MNSVPASVVALRPTLLLRRTTKRVPEWLGLTILLVATAFGYLWSLSASGYANSFYSAAVQAGSTSWKAFFFGSLDAGNSITVDKPPASLWVMELSVRLFGLSSWSILAPEALMGVATVALVYATVRRVADAPAALLAGAATALTPSAALMFRFNNPDALLLLMLVAAGYATLRAAEMARGRWLVLAGVLVGLAFLTKLLQAFLVLPAFILVYAVAAPTSFRRRVAHLVGACVAMVVSAGWWVAIVELWPASDRPYVDGSTDDSILQLALGYNGLGRLTGNETGGLGNAGFSSGVGPLRLFEGVSGGMVGWLLPAALVLLVAALVALRGAPRTDRTRAVLLLAGGSMLVTGSVFSFMGGIYHDYYTVALAPWMAMTAVLGGVVLWRSRTVLAARAVLAATVALSAWWAFHLLGPSGEQPYDTVRWIVLPLGVGLAALLGSGRGGRRFAVSLVAATAVVLSIGPAAYAVDTISTPHTGAIVTAGPVSMGGSGAGGLPGHAHPRIPGAGGPAPWGSSGPGGPGAAPTNPSFRGTEPGQAMFGKGGSGGGMLGGTSVSSKLTALLEQDASSYTWVAATVRSESAASYQLATEHPVMAIGGFNGTAPSPTLAQFKKDVAQGRIHYFIASGFGDTGADGAPFDGRGAGGPGMPGGPSQRQADSSGARIQSWVSKHFTARTVDGVSIYDLSAPAAGRSA